MRKDPTTKAQRHKRLFATLCLGVLVVTLLPSAASAHEGLPEQIAAITAKIKRDPKNASLYLHRGELYGSPASGIVQMLITNRPCVYSQTSSSSIWRAATCYSSREGIVRPRWRSIAFFVNNLNTLKRLSLERVLWRRWERVATQHRTSPKHSA